VAEFETKLEILTVSTVSTDRKAY